MCSSDLHRSLRRACTMAHAFRHDEALSRRKIDDAIFQIDQEPPIEHEKEFVDVVVYVPVIFALHYCDPDDGVVHFAKRLIVPFVGASISEFLHVDQFKRLVQSVQISLVGKFFDVLWRSHDLNFTAEIAQVAEKKQHICSTL